MLRSCSVYYANARDIRFDVPAPAAMLAAASRGEYQLVAYIDARDAEHVYERLQNGIRFDDIARNPLNWTEELNPTESAPAGPQRSMSVGDLIVWAGGEIEVCHPVGFRRFHGGRCENMLARRLQGFSTYEEPIRDGFGHTINGQLPG